MNLQVAARSRAVTGRWHVCENFAALSVLSHVCTEDVDVSPMHNHGCRKSELDEYIPVQRRGPQVPTVQFEGPELFLLLRLDAARCGKSFPDCVIEAVDRDDNCQEL
ncbi:hypothetical protein AB3X91_18970 [Paraburkholderia sp. BR14263]|uniref:hypothetical protein n=1 Tax=unclassified Paraburkholderia TaxID=2615204 RepID=UPI0034CFAD67